MPVSDTFSKIDQDGFVRAYQEAFGGAPYFETYTYDEVVEDVWTPHLKDGIVILALDEERVVGFGCALPVPKSPADIKKYLQRHVAQGALTTALDRMWYMSELGVVSSHRRRGIGYALVKHRLLTINHRGDSHYVFRTAAQGSNSIHLYRNIGATELAEPQDVSTSEQVRVNQSKSTERVYLYGDCESAIQQLIRAGR